MPSDEPYLDLLRRVRHEGALREGRNGGTLSLFGASLRFSLRDGFPLLTTKRVFWKGVVEELLWFLKGNTNANELAAKGVHIWDGNSTREFLDSRGLTAYRDGMCGPIYGWQWRRFGASYPSGTGGVDQLRYVLHELSQPGGSRRAVMSAWNPLQLSDMCLPPCHVSYSFYTSSKGLSCHMYQRSSDMFLGEPFNIASTALLTAIVAHVLGMDVDEIYISITDAHIYDTHLLQVDEQLSRAPRAFPHLCISKAAPPAHASVDEKLAWIEALHMDDFEVLGYDPHPTIKAAMVA